MTTPTRGASNRGRLAVFPSSQKLSFGTQKLCLADDDEDVVRVSSRCSKKSEGYSDDDLELLLRRFSAQHVDRVSRENLPPRALVFGGHGRRGALGSQEPHDFDPDILEQCGFDIMVQVLYLSYFDLKTRLQEARQEAAFEGEESAPSSPQILAQETPYLDQDDEDFDQLSCKVVPETMAFPDDPVEGTSEKVAGEKRSGHFVSSFIEPEISSRPPHQIQQIEQEDDKDLQLREKYGSLKCILSEQEKSEGVLGNGPCPVGLKSDRAEGLFEESPSLLSRSKREVPIKFEPLDSDDDFKSSGPPSPEVKTKRSSVSPPKKRAKVANRFGIYVEPITMSQKEKTKNMKQKNIYSFFGANGSTTKTKSKDEDDDDIKTALELSKQTMKEEQLKRRLQKSPLKDLDDSFDRLPEKKDRLGDLGYKYAHATVRSKAERKQLIGFQCPDCEKFYANEDLSDAKRQELIQRCSRHRAKFAPSAFGSPKEPWKVTISDDEELEKTQIGPPLRARLSKRNIKL